MGAFFSNPNSCTKSTKKSPGVISDVDRAVLDLKNARDRLNRYRTKLDQDHKKLLTRAKACQEKGDKSMAVGLLRLRKHKMKEAENVDGQLLKVLEMVDTIIGKENEKDLLQAMSEGKNALEQLHSEMSVDDILKLMDDIQEQSEVQKEIDEVVGQGLGLSAADESEIEAELEEMEEALKKEQGKEEEGEEKEVEEGEEKEEEKEGEEIPSLPEAPQTPLPELPTKNQEEMENVQNQPEPEPMMVAS